LTAFSSLDWKSRRLRAFVFVSLALILCFCQPLIGLARFSLSSDLYSYIVLVPFVSIYLLWLGRGKLTSNSRPDHCPAVFFLLAGLVALLMWWMFFGKTEEIQNPDSLSLSTLSFVLIFWSLCAWFLGRQSLLSATFPLGFLFLMVPFPAFMRHWAEGILQSGSAGLATALFKLSGTPVYSRDLIIQLPDISLQVAPECSGIHSSLALFITSLLAGYFFLRSNLRRCTLTAAVIPLAFLRNGIRIYTIGELCVHVGPNMIDSYIHRHGGPIFFTLSLIPFAAILFSLMRHDHVDPKRNPSSSAP
jgi:exosortase C (VPDSG-CTERM-specific)